jgi:enoyl-CoA hydratase/carnithine racemase
VSKPPNDDVRSEHTSGIARVTINRPERRNAMTWDVVRGLRKAVAAAKADPEVRVLVLAGEGTVAFCAGADLGGMAHGPQGPGFLELHDGRGELAGLFQDLWTLGKPTIARVQGWAVAGGFGLALACDLVVAGQSARFAATEVKVGLWPYLITVPLLRSIPPKVALELMLTGRTVGAEEGQRIGFVTRVVPDEDVDAVVEELAAAVSVGSPAVTRLGLEAFYAVSHMAVPEALAYLHAMLTLTTRTEDAAEGIAAFSERRPPQWQGR